MIRLLRVGWIALALLALTGCNGGRYWSRAEIALIERLNSAVAASNAKAKIAFDPASETIIAAEAEYLVRHYNLNVAHRHDEFNSGPKQRMTHRVVRFPGCSRVKAITDQSYSLGRSTQTDICRLVLYGETPPPNALTIRKIWRQFIIDGFEVSRLQIIIRRPDGRYASLLHFRGPSDGPQKTGPLIAEALGLKPRNNVFANLPGPDEVERMIASSTSRVDRFKYALLDQLAEDGKLPPDAGFSASQFEPAAIAQRAEALVNQFEAKAHEPDLINYWDSIGSLLARLPDKEWTQNRQKIFSALMAAPKSELHGQEPLMLRLTDLGADAAPLLLRASDESHVQAGVALAACRIGAPAAPMLGKTFLAAWERDNQPKLMTTYGRRNYGHLNRGPISRLRWERCVEDAKKYGPPDNIALSACWAYPRKSWKADTLYIALKRMGYGDQADTLARHNNVARWKKDYGSVGPHSPASVCNED